MSARATTSPPRFLRQLSFVVPVAMIGVLTFALAVGRSRGSLGDIAFAVALSINMVLLALSSWSGILGAVVAFCERCGGRFAGPARGPPTGKARTAVILPVYEEDLARVFAAAEVMSEALDRECLGTIEIFVLSDTQSAGGIATEDAIAAAFFATLRPEPGNAPIFYRRRARNIGRKAGNIADFCERWGNLYDFMIVLDADSLMSGAAMSALIGAMEANPRAGLIQSMIYPWGHESLFARVQQFGARLAGPLLAKGAAFWQGAHGSYWGHNTIIRLSAFSEHCGLPILPGSAPLGGEILCHDTIEAALMLRGDWDVWLIPEELDDEVGGSWDEVPTNFVDFLARDKRWCQGNLQHGALLSTAGFRLASLVHISAGIAHYLGAPLFLVLLAMSSAAGPSASPAADRALLVLALVLLFAPKVLALVHVLSDKDAARRLGGRTAVCSSVVLDQLLGFLIAPVTLVHYTAFVVTTLAGRVVRWDRLARDDRGLGWRETCVHLGPLLGLALALAIPAALVSPLAVAMIAPGILLGIPLAVLTSKASIGRLAARFRLFMIPEEVERLELLTRLIEADRRLRGERPTQFELPYPLPKELGRPIAAQLLRSKLWAKRRPSY